MWGVFYASAGHVDLIAVFSSEDEAKRLCEKMQANVGRYEDYGYAVEQLQPIGYIQNGYNV